MAKASTSKKTAKKGVKTTAKRGAEKKPGSSAASTEKMLKLIQALDLEVLHLKFKTSPATTSVSPKLPSPALAFGMPLAALPAVPAAAEKMADDLTGGMPSFHANPKLWQRLLRLCLQSMEKKLALNSPASQGLVLSKPAELELYVISQEERFDQLDLHNAAFKALADAGHALAVIHAKAAAKKVESLAPGDPGAKSILDDLRSLSNAIRGDQNFSTVLNLLEAATAACAGTPGT